MPGLEIKFLKFHEGQKRIWRNRPRLTVIRAGRRFGKTTMLEQGTSYEAAMGKHIGWFVPVSKYFNESYSNIRTLLRPLIKRASKTEKVIQLITGGQFNFYTFDGADGENAGRGRSFDIAVIDEASLQRKGLERIVNEAIMPTLLDRDGAMIMAGTPKGIDADNYFYRACTDPELRFAEFHAPSRANPNLSSIALARHEAESTPLVWQQEYLAEFVDWSGAAFFKTESLLVDGNPVPMPEWCDTVYATLDSATKTGKEHDGTAVVYWAYIATPDPHLVILDWDIVQIEGALLETWLPNVFMRLDEFARKHLARMGSQGAWIEDKASGMILIQQARRRGWPATAIDGKLTSVGKDERAISVSGYVHTGKVKIGKEAYEKTVAYKGQNENHFRKQIHGYRVGVKDQQDDLLDSFTYGISIGLGDEGGY